MKVESIYLKSPKGIIVEFRSASVDEAQNMIDYLKKTCGETRFLLSEPEDISYTEESEKEFLKKYEESPRALMLNAYIDGVLVGNGSFDEASSAKRMCHRANLGIALFQEYCGQGIGEMLMNILIEQAKTAGYEIMELDVFAKNLGAIHLYEKLGFVECARVKNAIKYKDGSYDDEVKMQKFLALEKRETGEKGFRVSDAGDEREIAEIHSMLRTYNLAHREKSEDVPLEIFYEDENGKKLAGITAETFGKWLCIHYLIVSEELRGQGIGKKLLTTCEEEARKRGCRYVFVDTFSFQAPGLYKKMGYKEVFALTEYPYTGSRYYYTKEL